VKGFQTFICSMIFVSNQNVKDTAAKITPRAIETIIKSIDQAMNLSAQLAKISPDGYSVFDVGDEVDDIFEL
jgi:hypothetical protein